MREVAMGARSGKVDSVSNPSKINYMAVTDKVNVMQTSLLLMSVMESLHFM